MIVQRCAQRTMRSARRRRAATACALALASTLVWSTALAKEPPPFPILYGGWAYLDDDPLPQGTRLTGRVRDYEAWTTVEQDGYYRNLVVAPPSREYYTAPVTFHALGLVAEEQDLFQATQGPAFKIPPAAFNLHFRRPVALASPTPVVQAGEAGGTGWQLVLLAGAGLVAAMVLLVARRAVRRARAG